MLSFSRIFLVIVFVLISNITFSQTYERSSGISIGVQDLHLDFNIPVHLSQKTIIAPSFGIISNSSNSTDISFGASLKFYLSQQKMSSFFGGRLGGITLIPEKGSNILDFLIGGFFGGEYNIDKNFSISGELQLNLTVSDESSNRFGNPGGINLNTGTFLYLTFYFTD